jgi:hypothetical protein
VKLALGTAQFGMSYGIANTGGQVLPSEVKLMLQQASASDIDILDTAIVYGESEMRLGQIGIENFKVVTKLPAVPKAHLDIKEWVKFEFEGSLSRLGVSNVYGLLLHRSDELLGPSGRELYKALNLLKQRGLVKKIGVSIYSPNELQLLKTDFNFDLVQAPFNIIDQRLFNSGWMQRLKNDGVEIHTRSAFLQGLLLMKEADIPSKFSPWKYLWKQWHDWLSENNVSALQGALTFALSFPEIDRVVVGADSHHQLMEIINAANNLLNNDLPNLVCADENLINPTNWPQL